MLGLSEDELQDGAGDDLLDRDDPRVAQLLDALAFSEAKRKEKDALAMSESLSAETRDAVFANIKSAMKQTNDYKAVKTVTVPSFLEAA